MNTWILVRILIFIYVLAGSFFVYLLWRNPVSTDSLKAAGILAAGLIPTFIAIAPLFKQKNVLSEKISAVIFFNENEKTIHQTFLDPYSKAYFSLTSNLDPELLISREIGNNEVGQDTAKEYWLFYGNEKGLDLMERLVLHTMVTKFYNHWDVHPKTHLTPTGKRSDQNPDIQNKNVVDIKVFELVRDSYQHNDLMIKTPYSILPPEFAIPKGCTVKVEVNDIMKAGDKRNRKLIFDVKNECKLTISVSSAGGGIASSGVWGLFPPNEDLKSLNYHIDIQLDYREFSINGSKYLNWYQNTVQEFKKLDWESIDNEIEKGLMRKILSDQQSNK